MDRQNKKHQKETSQAGIAARLKILTLCAAIVGALFFGVCGVSIIRNEYLFEEQGISDMPVLLLVGITAVFCYAALWQFWKVCCAIGNDNSFSMENYVSFRIMSGLFVILGIIWLLSIGLYMLLTDSAEFRLLFRMFEYTFVWFAVGGLTGALARLIDKARRIREENDLTI
ncbi:MAG: DUF2975 domain-containing protein [Lachnospiraceae bacterium]|nr:DUF2975 domain-containing protein [Lachnospiraceae bacterium]MBO7633253.1 DUF2975 domain-containing protein [Lachnospiraceae bacterium]MBP5653176.1 DUF2975 domain-containing protein [Lachnospiraceae bacterium]